MTKILPLLAAAVALSAPHASILAHEPIVILAPVRDVPLQDVRLSNYRQAFRTNLGRIFAQRLDTLTWEVLDEEVLLQSHKVQGQAKLAEPTQVLYSPPAQGISNIPSWDFSGSHLIVTRSRTSGEWSATHNIPDAALPLGVTCSASVSRPTPNLTASVRCNVAPSTSTTMTQTYSWDGLTRSVGTQSLSSTSSTSLYLANFTVTSSTSGADTIFNGRKVSAFLYSGMRVTISHDGVEHFFRGPSSSTRASWSFCLVGECPEAQISIPTASLDSRGARFEIDLGQTMWIREDHTALSLRNVTGSSTRFSKICHSNSVLNLRNRVHWTENRTPATFTQVPLLAPIENTPETVRLTPLRSLGEDLSQYALREQYDCDYRGSQTVGGSFSPIAIHQSVMSNADAHSGPYSNNRHRYQVSKGPSLIWFRRTDAGPGRVVIVDWQLPTSQQAQTSFEVADNEIATWHSTAIYELIQ